VGLLLPVPAKWVRGKVGFPWPLPKVLLWSEEKSLKLKMYQWKEDYLPIVALPVTDESSLK